MFECFCIIHSFLFSVVNVLVFPPFVCTKYLIKKGFCVRIFECPYISHAYHESYDMLFLFSVVNVPVVCLYLNEEDFTFVQMLVYHTWYMHNVKNHTLFFVFRRRRFYSSLLHLSENSVFVRMLISCVSRTMCSFFCFPSFWLFPSLISD